jgi:pilus assembly protein Flp/PilA
LGFQLLKATRVVSFPQGEVEGGDLMMQNAFLKLYVKARIVLDTLKQENGQDLIEYALVVALIAFAATAGMNTLATGINTAFSNISTRLNSAIT